jgi:hypothetical protein
MGSNRRSFLQMAGFAPAVAAGFATPAIADAATGSTRELTRSAFAACVGDEFMFEQGPFAQCVARLSRVAPLAADATAEQAEHRFSALFEVPAGEGLAQETYRVSHARLGRFVMFVSPKDGEGRVLEAVFNRL